MLKMAVTRRKTPSEQTEVGNRQKNEDQKLSWE